MKTTLKDIKDDFYTITSKTSDIVRNLAFAGIAIIWIFKVSEKEGIHLLPSTIPILKLFIWCLVFDFCHAFIPSITYGILNKILRTKEKTNDSEVEYSLLWEAPDWIFYLLKILFLIWAYINLLLFLNTAIL